MSTGIVIAIIAIVAIALLVAGAALWMTNRRQHLREQFGPEYDRLLAESQDRRAVERELRDRERRHSDLGIKPLPPQAREKYSKEWAGVQEQFVDAPARAVGEADGLVTRLMRERGYPTEGYEQQVRDLSVEHGRTLDHYRAAHAVSTRVEDGQATTEDLRGAFVHYRAVFDDLMTPGLIREQAPHPHNGGHQGGHKDGPSDGHSDGRADGPSDGRSDNRADSR